MLLNLVNKTVGASAYVCGRVRIRVCGEKGVRVRVRVKVRECV
jgi:hypothetical protein